MERYALNRRDFIKFSALVSPLLAGCGSGSLNKSKEVVSGGVSSPGSSASDTQQVIIIMNEDTLGALDANGYSLYIFQAVQVSTQVGNPVVWSVLSALTMASSTYISWSNNFNAYTSFSSNATLSLIEIADYKPVTVGETATVMANALITVSNGGSANAINFFDTVTNTPFTFGIQQQRSDSSFGIVCALEMFYDYVYLIQPVNKVLLMMSSLSLMAGTVVTKSSGPSLLINMNGQDSRTVFYDINMGWTWGTGTWGTVIDGNQDIAPYLVEYSSSLATKAKIRRSELV